MTTLWNPRKPLNQPPHFRSMGTDPSPARDDAGTIAANTHRGAQFERHEKTARRGGRAVVTHGGAK